MKIKQLMTCHKLLSLTDVPSIDHYTAGRVANKEDRYRKMDASQAAPSLPEGKCSTP